MSEMDGARDPVDHLVARYSMRKRLDRKAVVEHEYPSSGVLRSRNELTYSNLCLDGVIPVTVELVSVEGY
jgi:hypothetical protein